MLSCMTTLNLTSFISRLILIFPDCLTAVACWVIAPMASSTAKITNRISFKGSPLSRHILLTILRTATKYFGWQGKVNVCCFRFFLLDGVFLLIINPFIAHFIYRHLKDAPDLTKIRTIYFLKNGN